jgi:hypothetical protein
MQDTNKLKYFRMRYKKLVYQTIMRCYRTIIVLYKYFPDSRDENSESIFDKIYLLQVFLVCQTNFQYQKYNKQYKSNEFEEIARNVLISGGTKTKSVKEITETSKIIKDKID